MSGAGGLDPGFTDALDRMFAAAPGHLGITSGYRSYDEQAKLYAEKGPGLAAKPGTSWHEFGLAVDLNWDSQGVLNWAHQHAAEYGLFFPMSWEPWHIQPLWTQNRKPSDMAQPGDGQSQQGNAQDAGFPKQSSVDSMLGAFGSMMTAPDNWSNQYPQSSTTDIGEGNPGAPAAAKPVQAKYDANMGYKGAYDLAIAAGASPDDAKILAAIAGAESSYDPSSHNTNAGTGDNSYGLWQINMLGSMGPERLAALGLQNNDQLFDPLTNAKAALYILHQQGWGAWTTYNDGAYRKYMQ